MSSPWIFICPASRGIGHALTRRLLQTTTLPILASTRRDPSSTKSSILEGLQTSSSNAEDLAPRLSVVTLDVTDESSIRDAAARAKDLFPPKSHHLHLACAIPGILHPEKSPRQIDAALSLESFRINTIGPLLLIKHFAELLPKNATKMDREAGLESQGEETSDGQIRLPQHATWLNMSARVGSITDNKAGGWYSYRASKTAVSSITKSFDNHLRVGSGDNAMAMSYHPGTVKTDLSKEFWGSVEKDKLFSPEYAAERMVDVIRGLELSQRGKCWDWKNEEVLP
jgi:NAD(P)-dependent dehydrogenase (short-subunit alcohol dehydrogenase family)